METITPRRKHFSMLEPKGYKTRLIEPRLDALMRGFGCVDITGPKWCGKTWTASSRAASITKLDVASERIAAETDPSLALTGEKPHLIDEWQEVPEVWDACRRAIDDSGNIRGSYLLTGSTNLPESKREKVRHTGTGRIARLTMRPMTLIESGDAQPKISLLKLLEGKNFEPARQETSIEDVARWCCRGGWPANLGLDDAAAMETPSQYIQSVLDTNIIDEGKSPTTAMALMRALAMNASQATTYKTLAKDMALGESSKVAVDTIASYLELFERLHLIENLTGWEPPMRAKARVRVKPKRYFVDPSLAAALLGATPSKLLKDMQTLGLLFENLVLRDLRVFMSCYPGLGNSIHYYHDDKGLEVDAIVEYQGQWAGIEIKLSETKVDDGAKNLLALRNKVTKNPEAQNAEPVFLAVIVGKGSLAYKRPDGVYVIPIGLLGA